MYAKRTGVFTPSTAPRFTHPNFMSSGEETVQSERMRAQKLAPFSGRDSLEPWSEFHAAHVPYESAIWHLSVKVAENLGLTPRRLIYA
jgi:hypothetical protein